MAPDSPARRTFAAVRRVVRRVIGADGSNARGSGTQGDADSDARTDAEPDERTGAKPDARTDDGSGARTDGGFAQSDDREAGGRPDTGGGRTPGGGLRAWIEDRVGEDVVSSAPFWLPPFLLMGFFVYGAVGWNVVISLTDYRRFTGPDYSDLDFEMYRTALESGQVQTAAANTLLLMIGFTVVALALGLVIAILVDRKIRFENTFRTIYLLPMSLSFVVTAQFWLWMYDADGVINRALGVFGIDSISFIGNQSIVLWAIVFALVWQFSGYTMVVYLAALRAIPTDQFEAARVDGAGVVKMYWRVIVPQLKSATVSASVVLMVFALKAFDFLFALVGGYRPPNGADILATKMVREAFQQGRWAYGSAIALILFLMALSVIGPYLYYEYRNDNL